jgi:hypothetical protein
MLQRGAWGGFRREDGAIPSGIALYGLLSPKISRIWRDSYFLPHGFHEIVRLVRGHHHTSKDAPAQPHQHASYKERPIHQAKSEDGKQSDEGDMFNVRDVFERRPPNAESSEHHELNGIVCKSVFPAARP